MKKLLYFFNLTLGEFIYTVVMLILALLVVYYIASQKPEPRKEPPKIEEDYCPESICERVIMNGAPVKIFTLPEKKVEPHGDWPQWGDGKG